MENAWVEAPLQDPSRVLRVGYSIRRPGIVVVEVAAELDALRGLLGDIL